MQTIFASDTFTSQLPAVLKWYPQGDRYAFIEADGKGQRIVSRTVSGETETALALKDIQGLPTDFRLTDFQGQPDSGFILLKGQVATDWQGYKSAPWYAYHSKTKLLRPLGEEGQALQLVKLAPGGRHAGFVFDNNMSLLSR